MKYINGIDVNAGDSLATSFALRGDGRVTGSAGATDTDNYQSIARAFGPPHLSLCGPSAGLDSRLLDAAGAGLRASGRAGTGGEDIGYAVTANQTYYARVNPHAGAATGHQMTVAAPAAGDAAGDPDAGEDPGAKSSGSARASGDEGGGAGSLIQIFAVGGAGARNEGNSGISPYLYSVIRDTSIGSASVKYAVRGAADGYAAAAGSDFAGGLLPSGTIRFAAGEYIKVLAINVAGDTTAEGDERFNVTLSSPINATLAPGGAFGIIRDDDANGGVSLPTIEILSNSPDDAKSEGDNGNTAFPFTVSRSNSSGTSSVKYAVTGVAGNNGAAASSGDFAGAALPGGTIVFANGETSKVLTINVTGDAASESDEYFKVTLSSPANATLGANNVADGTIYNDDNDAAASSSSTIDIGSASADTVKGEGDGGATAYLFSVSRSGASGAAAVDYAVVGAAGGALSGDDFAGRALPRGTLRFASGETSKVLALNVAGDTTVEGDERFDVILSNPVNATLGLSRDFGIIDNDDDRAGGGAGIDIGSSGADSVKSEGDSGATKYSFTVTRGDPGGAASVKYTVTGVADGAHAAANGADFAGKALPSGTIRFAAGEASKLLTINLAGDTAAERDERFDVTLSSPVNATLGRSSDFGIIVDDDAAGGASAIDISSSGADTVRHEGGDGATAYLFTVSRASARGAASVKYAVSGVADGVNAAASGGDFAGGALPSGTIRFANGETSKLLAINVAGDATPEGDERFDVTLSSPSNATLGRRADFGVIEDDDDDGAAAAEARIDIGSNSDDAIKSEGDSGATAYTFTVSRSGASGAASVEYAVGGAADDADGALTGADFVGRALPSGTIDFASGETSKQLTINVAGDTASEASERFDVTLSNPVNATLGQGSDFGIIGNDDAPATIDIGSTGADTIKNEGAGGATKYTFSVTRDGASGAATVKYAVSGVADGVSAAAGVGDFRGGALPSGTIRFANGETSKLLTINVAGDTAAEANERFDVTLSSPTNATLGRSSDFGIIINDDGGAGVTLVGSPAAPLPYP